METVDRAKKKDMTIDEMTYFYNKKNSWKKDEELDKTKAVTKVRNTFPAVELKLFGINEAGKEYWKSLGLPKEIKMGWFSIIECVLDLSLMQVYQLINLNSIGNVNSFSKV